MEILPGQGLKLKGHFANGTECDYKRPFLIIECSQNIIKALNISSLKGKEIKLAYPSNKKLDMHYPPFPSLSFVKLDEVYNFEACYELEHTIMCNGKTLDDDLFNKVLDWYTLYNKDNKVEFVHIDKVEIVTRNPYLSDVKRYTS